MTVEIERKFLVLNDAWRDDSRKRRNIVDHLIGRFENENGKARIRICDNSAVLTIKGPRRGYARSEFHVALDDTDATSMIAEFSRGAALEKTRHDIAVGGLVWQVDEYLGRLKGLLTCDVELPSEGWPIDKPSWVGAEITGDPRFSSATLAALLEGNDEDGLQSILVQAGAGSVHTAF